MNHPTAGTEIGRYHIQPDVFIMSRSDGIVTSGRMLSKEINELALSTDPLAETGGPAMEV